MTYDTDVAIIGYGPVGVSAANTLGSYGVRTIALERWTDIYARARAVTVNDWTLRCFQSVGLAQALIANMDETFALRWKTYDGHELTRMKFKPGNLGYNQSYSIYQPAMEQTLRDGAARYETNTVRYGQEVVGTDQDGEGVTVTARDVATGEISSIRARYAIACDGGSSPTRERLGIALLGDTIETEWVIIDAQVKRWWPDRHILTFWSDKKRPVVDIALALGTHRWELPLEAHETQADFRTHEQLWPLLNSMGVTQDEVAIHQHAFYKHHVRSAERWRVGRIVLAGDAAHLMPPWAGQGMQSGIRDAFNLGWKLAGIIDGSLPEAILDSYQVERGPNVAMYTTISYEFGRLVKQQVSEEELAAQAPPPGEDPPPSPLLAPPEMAQGWLSGSSGAGSVVGKYLPQPSVAASNGKFALLDTIIGNGFVLLGDNVDPASLLTTEQREGWDRIGASYRTILSPDKASHDGGDIIDLEETLLAWIRGFGARAIAVRPDRFVAASDVEGLSVPVWPDNKADDGLETKAATRLTAA